MSSPETKTRASDIAVPVIPEGMAMIPFGGWHWGMWPHMNESGWFTSGFHVFIEKRDSANPNKAKVICVEFTHDAEKMQRRIESACKKLSEGDGHPVDYEKFDSLPGPDQEMCPE